MKHLLSCILFVADSVVTSASSSVPLVPLFNAAVPGQMMPGIGLGTGGYGTTHNSYNAYPECWMEIAGCSNYTIEATKTWIQLGGRRLDAADSYDTQTSVGIGMKQQIPGL